MARTASGVTDALLIIEILRRIPRSKKVTARDIQAGLSEIGQDIKIRRLQRILASIVECANLGIEVDTASRPFGYRKRMTEPELQTVSISPKEALLLRLAEEYLRNQLPRQLLVALDPEFQQAKEILNETSGLGREKAWLQKVALVSNSLPMMPPHINKTIFDTVTEALYRDSKLTVTYVNSQDTQLTKTISPLGLVQQDNRLYLVCQFDGYGNYRHLALHRIRKIRLCNEAANRPKSFSLKSYVRERHFNFSDGQKVALCVVFANPVFAKNMQETPFNSTQQLKKNSDGTWTLSAVLDDSPAINGWIASWQANGGSILSWAKKPLPEPDQLPTALRQRKKST